MPLLNGHWRDFIDLWLSFTEAGQSPPQFNLWTGISLVASALERRVWAAQGRFLTYPNLYVMLVGSPGVGKGIIEEAASIFKLPTKAGTNLPAFKTASDSVTRASLTDELAKAKQVLMTSEGARTYHAMTLFSEEFRVILPSYEQDFVSRLDRLYNNPQQHNESRRTGSVRQLTIDNPCLNLLVGAQPAYLSHTFPDDVWATGMARRLLMIYASEGSMLSIFADPGDQASAREEVVSALQCLSAPWGLVRWTPEAAGLIEEFDLDWKERTRGGKTIREEEWPLPTHSRLIHFVRSRTMLVIKLAIISAFSARLEPVIRLSDAQRALGWLLSAEVGMPDIFREMRGKSDSEVIGEMHRYAMAIWAQQRGKPIPSSVLISFLSDRVMSERVERVLLIAERSDYIKRIGGTDTYVPQPLIGRRGLEP